MLEQTFSLLAATNQDIFGSPITPPNAAFADPIGGLSRLAAVGIQVFFVIAAIAVLIYLLWGAFEWITSGGDSDNIAKAQARMTNAVIGLILVIVAFSIFNLVAVDIVGFVERDENGDLRFKIPSINDPRPGDPGFACSNNSDCNSGVCQTVTTGGSLMVTKQLCK